MQRRKSATLQPVELKSQLLQTPGFASPTLDQLTSNLPAVKKLNSQLQKKSRSRLKKYIHHKMESSQMDLTLSEQKAIGEWAAKYYNEEYQSLVSFAKSVGASAKTPKDLDAALTKYFNHLFDLAGTSSPSGRQDPGFSDASPASQGTEKLPHRWRSLKGWRQLAPGSSWKAYPLAVWAAICCEMKRKGYLQMALFTMMGLSSYARPGELLRCRVYSLVRPSPAITEFWTLPLNPEGRADRSKVGEFDDSLPLDSPYLRPWASQLLNSWWIGAPSFPFAWCFDYSHYSKVFSQVADALGLNMTPYNRFATVDPQSTKAEIFEACWRFRNGEDGEATRVWPGTKSVQGWRQISRPWLHLFNITAFSQSNC